MSRRPEIPPSHQHNWVEQSRRPLGDRLWEVTYLCSLCGATRTETEF